MRLLAIACFLFACGDNDPATPDAAVAPDADPSPRAVTLQFQPTVGTQPFACGQSYPDLGAEGTTVTPRDFRIYIHDVKLVAEDGTRVPLVLEQDGTWQHQNLAFLDFEDFTGACQDGTPETRTRITGTAPNGTYHGVELTIGVPEAMNHVDLVTQPAPLNVTGLWWGWQFGHIFLAVATHAAAGPNDHYFHLGSIGCTGDPAMGQPVTCAKPNRALVTVTGFDPLTQPIIADFGALLPMSKLGSTVGCHSFTQEACAWPFDFVGLNWFTGSQTPSTQKLFRAAP